MSEQDDSEIFRQFVGDVEPVKQGVPGSKPPVDKNTPSYVERRRAAQAAVSKEGNYLAQQEYIAPVKPWDLLSFKRDGVQHGVFRSLKQGKYSIDASIDLHGHTVAQARREVFDFIGDCMVRDIRCAMITHGKGQHRDPPALLKSCVNHWLTQLEDVLAFHSARPSHGGSGSTYVLLRKSLSLKEKNRQKFVCDS